MVIFIVIKSKNFVGGTDGIFKYHKITPDFYEYALLLAHSTFNGKNLEKILVREYV